MIESANHSSRAEYDVFLSYAHVNNNEKGPGGAWVSEFRLRLGAALDARLGRTGQSRFFFDVETLGKNVEFGPQIEDALKKSATFVAVISKGYIESLHCREELRFFDQIVQGPVSKSGRLYLVWYDAQDAQSEWSAEHRKEFTERVHGLIGYEFFAPVPAVPPGRPRRPDEFEYQTRLAQLTAELAKYLADREKIVQPHPRVATVLIGQSAPDHSIRRKRRDLANWCRNAHLRVLGERDYSTTPATFKSDFEADLRRAHLLVQLFGDGWMGSDDDQFPDGREAWQQRQAEKAGIKIIQWREFGIERPSAEERVELNDDELRHINLIFGSQVITAEPAELHLKVGELAEAAVRGGPIIWHGKGKRSLLIKVTEADYREHEITMLELGSQVMCSFVHNGRSVLEFYRTEKIDAVMVVLGKGCTSAWLDKRREELIRSSQSLRETGPVHAWFNAGDYPGAPPLLAPGFLMLRGKQELPILFKAIEEKGGAK